MIAGESEDESCTGTLLTRRSDDDATLNPARTRRASYGPLERDLSALYAISIDGDESLELVC